MVRVPWLTELYAMEEDTDIAKKSGKENKNIKIAPTI